MTIMPTATKPKPPAKPVKPRQQPQDAPAPGTEPTLTHAELMELAKRFPPPQAWFDDESNPFEPAPASAEKE